MRELRYRGKARAAGALQVVGRRLGMEALTERRFAREVPVARVLDHRAGGDFTELLVLQSEALDERGHRRGQHLLVARLHVRAVRARERMRVPPRIATRLDGVPIGGPQPKYFCSSLMAIASAIQPKLPCSFISRAPFTKCASARRSAPPTLMRLTPARPSCSAVIPGSSMPTTTLSGLATEEATVRIVARSRSPGA